MELTASIGTFDLLPALALHYDEPIVDSAMIHRYLVCNLVRLYCTVALAGDGGDELLAGYNHYCRVLQPERMIGLLPQLISDVAAKSAGILATGLRGRNDLIGMGGFR